jgi:hypothetical protein
MEKRPPLWKCPSCGHRFVTRNIWHSCARYSLGAHFRGKDPILRKIFDRFRTAVRNAGPATVYAQKTRIVFLTRVRFAGAIVHTHWLEGTLWLTRQARHPRLYRIETLGPRVHVHHFRLTDPREVDRGLATLAREAYLVGRQDHLRRERDEDPLLRD